MLDTIVIVGGLFFLGGLFLVSMIGIGADEPFEPFPVNNGISYLERIAAAATPSPTEDGRENQPETAEPDGRK